MSYFEMQYSRVFWSSELWNPCLIGPEELVRFSFCVLEEQIFAVSFLSVFGPTAIVC
jgi:hypothetical protein